MTRDEILKAAGEAVAERPDRHGQPEDAFGRIARAWEWYVAEKAGHTVPIDPHDVAVMMALFKICRLIERPDYSDHWADLAGYAACGGEVAKPIDPEPWPVHEHQTAEALALQEEWLKSRLGGEDKRLRPRQVDPEPEAGAPDHG